MDPVIVEYIIIDAVNAHSLQGAVQEKLPQGFQPHGQVIVKDDRWYQIMVKSQ